MVTGDDSCIGGNIARVALQVAGGSFSGWRTEPVSVLLWFENITDRRGLYGGENKDYQEHPSNILMNHNFTETV